MKHLKRIIALVLCLAAISTGPDSTRTAMLNGRNDLERKSGADDSSFSTSKCSKYPEKFPVWRICIFCR